MAGIVKQAGRTNPETEATRNALAHMRKITISIKVNSILVIPKAIAAFLKILFMANLLSVKFCENYIEECNSMRIALFYIFVFI